ncbi:hypothetical protein Pint_33381 [Pistacia integerrima]|uniref:Uncharacterized protein n=1 Tax=Pistacia integerrima TaxID=434235 RepID=A0ACC0X454_9ROSI|nr:hypothetical protein Pint_33381 [Pistacia integerrima]
MGTSTSPIPSKQFYGSLQKIPKPQNPTADDAIALHSVRLCFSNFCLKTFTSPLGSPRLLHLMAGIWTSPSVRLFFSINSTVPCALESGKYVYSSEGLLDIEFLDEHISMTQDPQQQSLLNCKCCPLERSRNEVWQSCGAAWHKLRTAVFFTPDGKGWGPRTLEKLQKGAFVCEFVGEILTITELYERNTKNHNCPVLLDAYWASKGVPKDEEALFLDATCYGNVDHRTYLMAIVEGEGWCELKIVDLINVTGKQREFAAFLNPANKPLTQIVQDDLFMEFEFRQYLFACQSKFLFKLNRPFEVASRGYLFIITFSKSLAQHEVSNISSTLFFHSSWSSSRIYYLSVCKKFG